LNYEYSTNFDQPIHNALLEQSSPSLKQNAAATLADVSHSEHCL